MRNVLNYVNGTFQVSPSRFSPNHKKQPEVIAEYKVSTKPEEKELSFSQMLNAELRSLT